MIPQKTAILVATLLVIGLPPVSASAQKVAVPADSVGQASGGGKSGESGGTTIAAVGGQPASSGGGQTSSGGGQTSSGRGQTSSGGGQAVGRPTRSGAVQR